MQSHEVGSKVEFSEAQLQDQVKLVGLTMMLGGYIWVGSEVKTEIGEVERKEADFLLLVIPYGRFLFLRAHSRRRFPS